MAVAPIRVSAVRQEYWRNASPRTRKGSSCVFKMLHIWAPRGGVANGDVAVAMKPPSFAFITFTPVLTKAGLYEKKCVV
jgi:hypothetical protein